MNKFWKNKRVFITGHTGFKGSWLSLWLYLLGAKVAGYALVPHTKPNLYNLCQIDQLVNSTIADIRDKKALSQAIIKARPEIIIHMAAQPIVRDSYKIPVETYSTNVMGTVNLLEIARQQGRVKAILNVTTDKVYENREQRRGYREDEPLGGYDPYSSSKACSEIVTTAYRCSYGMNVASARAGNVIGGGDWANDRLVPDFVRAILKGRKIRVRNPKAVRPWQHVLEPLSGYLMLAERLYKHGLQYAGAWNFGPNNQDARTVEWVVNKLCKKWGNTASFEIAKGNHPHETTYLSLDSSKARKVLGWEPKWNINQTLDEIVEWTKAYKEKKNLRNTCFAQIKNYEKTR